MNRVPITIRLPRSLSDRIDELAKAEGVSKNQFIILAVLLEIDRCSEAIRSPPPSRSKI
jgi:predicted transcriptional regulator